MSNATPLLQVSDLVAGYVPTLPIVQGVSLSLVAGEVLVVLGPNGAGKSTLVKALAGTVTVMGGSVMVHGAATTQVAAHERVACGVGFVPQTGNVFTSLSVEENLRAGGFLIAGGAQARRLLRERLDKAYAQFPALAPLKRLPAHALSGGQRQMLAIARALMTRPKLLLLDEPSAGLSPLMVSEVFAQVRDIAKQGVGVLMVEQNVKAGLRLADRGLIMVNGRVAHEGVASALLNDSKVAQLYLGRDVAHAPAQVNTTKNIASSPYSTGAST